MAVDSHIARSALEAYLDFLDTSSTTDKDQDPLPTPHIDSVLQHYRERVVGGDSSATETSDLQRGDHESRLRELEGQLSDLLQRSRERVLSSHKHTQPRMMKQRVPCSSNSEHSDSDTHHRTVLPARQPPGAGPRVSSHKETKDSIATQHRRTRNSLKPKNTKSSSAETERQARPGVQGRGVVSTGGGTGNDANEPGASPPAAGDLRVSSPGEDRRRKTRLLMETRRAGAQERETNGSTVQVLTRELEGERERRWKAEQAAERLVEHIRSLQGELGDSRRRHELAVVQVAGLERQLEGERNTVQTLQGQLRQVEESLSVVRREVEGVRGREGEVVRTLRALEEEHSQLQTQRTQERTQMAARLRESEQTVSGHQREVELLRRSLRQLKGQLQQTQELLATRERGHQKELERCKPLDGQEVQALVSHAVERERERVEGVVERERERVREREQAYQRLEDEFREALRIEATRFQELQRAYEEVSKEVEASRQTAVAAVRKEQRATAMVADLTALAKEQKGRIAELSRSKQEAVEEWRERVGRLEGEVAVKGKMEAQLQTLKEENSRLSAQVMAQESVIEGLREERKLWGRELAHQGASLAQDRGRMEAQVDSLSQEVQSLREQTQRDRDALRVREKVAEDQTQTIHQLKQALAAKEHEVRSRELDWTKQEQVLQLNLEQEEAASQDLQDQVSALVERKEQLKEELVSAQEEVDQWKSRFSKLKGQWDERVKVIGTLEVNLTQMQQNFAERETKLREERDTAMQQSRSVEERLRLCDDAFREQLEAQQRSHDQRVTKMEQEKAREIEQANQRVVAVEGEMRELLTEMAREKKNMEGKFQRLSRTFQELQQEMS